MFFLIIHENIINDNIKNSSILLYYRAKRVISSTDLYFLKLRLNIINSHLNINLCTAIAFYSLKSSQYQSNDFCHFSSKPIQSTPACFLLYVSIDCFCCCCFIFLWFLSFSESNYHHLAWLWHQTELMTITLYKFLFVYYLILCSFLSSKPCLSANQ